MKVKIENIVIILVVFIFGFLLRGCVDSDSIQKPHTKKEIIKIEGRTKVLKEEVEVIKYDVKYVLKPATKELKQKLDSTLNTNNYNKDTALQICIDVVSSQSITISKQDTIIAKQDSIIFNDSILKSSLNEDIVSLNNQLSSQKKEFRKRVVKNTILGGIIGFITGGIIGVVVKNT